MLGLDTETDLMREGRMIPPLTCVSWATPDGQAGVVGRADAHEFVRRNLHVPWVGTYLAYDAAVLMTEFPDLTVPIFEKYRRGEMIDVGIHQKLLDIARGIRGFRPAGGRLVKMNYSLEEMADMYLDWKLDKDDGVRLGYGALRDTPVHMWTERQREYAMLDAVAPLRIYPMLLERRYKDSHDVFMDAPAQARADIALQLMSAYGIATDQEWISDLDVVYAEEMAELNKDLVRGGLVRPDGSRDMKKAKALMLAALGSRCKLTDKGFEKHSQGMSREEVIQQGYISLDGEACKLSRDPLLVKLARYAHIQKLRGTYLDAFRGKRVLHARYEVLMDTGRTSCSNPPLQQLPREFGPRECLVARSGNGLISCDYDMAELVSVSQICKWVVGWSKLADRLCEGLDPHLDMVAQILKIPYDVARQRKEVGDREIDRIRTLGKVANFGIWGGMGADSLVEFAKATYDVDLEREDAVKLKITFQNAWPESRGYFDWVNRLIPEGAGHGSYVQWVSGRVRGRCAYTVLANTGFQGLTADGAKTALWEVTRRQFCEPTSSLYGTHCVGFFHDDILVEAPLSSLHEAAMEQRRVMIDEYNRFTPDVPVRTSPHAQYRWSKDAKPIYMNGRLIPWEDRPKEQRK